MIEPEKKKKIVKRAKIGNCHVKTWSDFWSMLFVHYTNLLYYANELVSYVNPPKPTTIRLDKTKKVSCFKPIRDIVRMPGNGCVILEESLFLQLRD